MATIRKRNQKWHVQVRRRGVKSLNRSFLFKSDAEAWARQTEGKLDRSELPPDIRELRALTTDDLMTLYLAQITPRKRGAEIERFRFKVMRRHGLGRLPLDRVTPSDFANYRDERLKTVGGETVRRELATLQHMFDVAKREWAIPLVTNPMLSVDKPKPGIARTRRLQGDEFARLMTAISKCRNRVIGPLFSCAVATGMRQGELLAARWEHLDLERRLLLLPLTKNGHARYVPLSAGALAAIASRTGGGAGGGEERIFPTTRNAVKLAWKRIVKRARITDLRFHDLRHEAISRMFEKGLTVPEVALVSGLYAPEQ